MGGRGRIEPLKLPILRLSDDDKKHILEGHRGSSTIPNKTRFPESWSDKKIVEAVEQTLKNPDRTIEPVFPNERYQAEKSIEGVTVRVSYYHQDGAAVFHSAYPIP
jgi:hypothetical protein